MKNIIRIPGAILAYLIGAGFATGQEALQFYASYGVSSLLGLLVSCLIFTFYCSYVMYLGNVKKYQDSTDFYQYVCGQWIGLVLKGFSLFLLFLIFTVMLSGAGAIGQDYFNWPNWGGSLIMAAACFVSVMIGFKRIIKVMGFLGPIVVVTTLVIASSPLIDNANSVFAFQQPDASLPQASESWWLSAILYPAFISIPMVTFLVPLSQQVSTKKEAALLGAGGGIVFFVCMSLLVMGMMAGMSIIKNVDVPMLALAVNLHPALGSIFSLILVAGIYTTATPLLWAVLKKLRTESKNKNLVISMIVVSGAFLLSLFPFPQILGFVFSSSGWVGIVFLSLLTLKLFYKENKLVSQI